MNTKTKTCVHDISYYTIRTTPLVYLEDRRFFLTQSQEFPEYRFVARIQIQCNIQASPFIWTFQQTFGKLLYTRSTYPTQCLLRLRWALGSATLSRGFLLSKQTLNEEWMGTQESKRVSEEVIFCRHIGQSVRRIRVILV